MGRPGFPVFPSTGYTEPMTRFQFSSSYRPKSRCESRLLGLFLSHPSSKEPIPDVSSVTTGLASLDAACCLM